MKRYIWIGGLILAWGVSLILGTPADAMRIGVREEAGARFVPSVWILAWSSAILFARKGARAQGLASVLAMALLLVSASALWFSIFGAYWDVDDMPGVLVALRVLIDIGLMGISIALPIVFLKARNSPKPRRGVPRDS